MTRIARENEIKLNATIINNKRKNYNEQNNFKDLLLQVLFQFTETNAHWMVSTVKIFDRNKPD